LSEDEIDKLLGAAYEDDRRTVTRLLDRGVDVNASPASAPGFTALHRASRAAASLASSC